MSPEQGAQIRKILDSATFYNTEVLKKLLDYLAHQEPAADLKEHTVGVEAFGKPQEYDPRTDASVRVQTGKLRLKLTEYYRTEGADDPVMVDLPKGGFRLDIHERAVPPKPARPSFWRHQIPVWFAFVIAVIPIIGDRLSPWRPGPPVHWTTEMSEFWSPFVYGHGRPIMVALGTPLFTRIGDQPAAPFNYTGVGEAAGAFALARLMVSRNLDLTLQTSDQLTLEDIGRHNMIFLGPPKYNLQTFDLPIHQDFAIVQSRVQNLKPNPGEPTSFEEKWAPDGTHLEEGHALISRLPGLHNTGVMLILAGSSTECTRAAVEYLTHPEYVTPFVDFLHKQQRGTMPAWFQAVVRARFSSGTPVAIERVAFHALQ